MTLHHVGCRASSQPKVGITVSREEKICVISPASAGQRRKPMNIAEMIKQLLIMAFTLQAMANRTEEQKEADFKAARAEFDAADLSKIKDV